MSDLIERAEKCAAEYAEKRDAATEGPWVRGIVNAYDDNVTAVLAGDAEICHEPYDVKGYSSCCIVTPQGFESNFDLIAHSRSTNAPEIIRELIEANKELEKRYTAALMACEGVHFEPDVWVNDPDGVIAKSVKDENKRNCSAVVLIEHQKPMLDLSQRKTDGE